MLFQSTPPAWGATSQPFGYSFGHEVSIHAPRVGGDAKINTLRENISKFQSTPPAWGATRTQKPKDGTVSVSIHAPRVGGDQHDTAR